jgi:hypothetical protein
MTAGRGSGRNSTSTVPPGCDVAAGRSARPFSALPYYWDTNPGIVRQASHALAQVLADG